MQVCSVLLVPIQCTVFVYTGEVNIDDEDEEVCRDVVGPDIEVAINMYSVHTK